MEACEHVCHERAMLNTKAHRYAYQRASIRLATSLCTGGLLHVHRTGSRPMKHGKGTHCKCPGSETHRRAPRLVSEINPVACMSSNASSHRLNRKPMNPFRNQRLGGFGTTQRAGGCGMILVGASAIGFTSPGGKGSSCGCKAGNGWLGVGL